MRAHTTKPAAPRPLAPLLASAPLDRKGHPILPGSKVRVVAPNALAPAHPVEFTGHVAGTPTLVRHGKPCVCVQVFPSSRQGSYKFKARHSRTFAPEHVEVLRQAAKR